MRKDKIKLYVFELLTLVVLFIALFVSINISRFSIAILLLLLAFLAKRLFPKKRILRYSAKETTVLMIVLGFLYIGIFYLLGLFFYTFNKQMITFGYKTAINFIIPFIIIIISSEEIRFTLLSQDGKIRIKDTKYDYSKILTFIIMVLIDINIYRGVYNLNELNDFLAILGFISFASISCNLYFNYYSNRYGKLGIILYRMITILYVYIIPIIPNMYLLFRSFLRMVYPYLMFQLMEGIFGKERLVESYQTKKNNAVLTIVLLIGMTLMTMLISCQFYYGILVVGSGSMTGAINKGDAIIYASYKKQTIQRGDVIIFHYNDLKMIHRVVDIRNVNGEIQYYTKGDKNISVDSDYRTKKDIIGISKVRIRYLGIPTLWVHSLFNK